MDFKKDLPSPLFLSTLLAEYLPSPFSKFDVAVISLFLWIVAAWLRNPAGHYLQYPPSSLSSPISSFCFHLNESSSQRRREGMPARRGLVAWKKMEVASEEGKEEEEEETHILLRSSSSCKGCVDGGESLRCLLRESTLEEKKEFVGRNSFSERRGGGGGNGPPRSLLGRK